MNTLTKVAVFSLSSIFLTACSSSAIKDQDDIRPIISVPQNADFDMSEVRTALIKASESASKSLRILAETNNAAKADMLTHDKVRQANWNASYVPVGMDRTIDFYWNSVFMPVVEMVADTSGYKLVEVNPNMRPLNFPTVTIDTNQILYRDGKPYKNNRLIDVLRSVSYQVESMGVDIKVLVEERIIQVEYGVR